MRILKQSTATTLLLGPFLDVNGAALTALTIAQANVLLWKEGGTTLAQKNDATSATHRSNGRYTVPINTTDTNTLGLLSINVDMGGAIAVRQDYTVLPANVFDALRGSDLLQVDMQQIINSATNAQRLETSVSTMVMVTIGVGSTTTNFTTNLTEVTNDHYKGRYYIGVTGALAGQATDITAYNGTTKALTVTATTDAPAQNDTGIIV